MKKDLMLDVLQELISALNESIQINTIFLNGYSPTNSLDDYIIRLNGNLDHDSRLTVTSIISKYDLIMKQGNDYTVIYTQ